MLFKTAYCAFTKSPFQFLSFPERLADTLFGASCPDGSICNSIPDAQSADYFLQFDFKFQIACRLPDNQLDRRF